MSIPNPQSIVDRLIDFQRAMRGLIVDSRRRGGMHEVNRSSAADTIYAIDALVEPLLDDFCRDWAKTTPLVLIAEGIHDELGNEGAKIFPQGAPAERAQLRVIIDPIDGTRGLMYDKRSAWALAGVAPNNGPDTRLSDIEIAVMTELPTSKMGQADVLWAMKGIPTRASRVDLASGASETLPIGPLSAGTINHGFATVSSFFPGTKVAAAELAEYLIGHLIDPADVHRATVFEDQYITTGGQLYEIIIGHDLFIADVRPLLYRIQGIEAGMCCHPYDCAAWLVAQNAGVILTGGLAGPLDGPLDVLTPISWAAYANRALHDKMQPLLTQWLNERIGRVS
jgi:hypothetical protein